MFPIRPAWWPISRRGRNARPHPCTGRCRCWCRSHPHSACRWRTPASERTRHEVRHGNNRTGGGGDALEEVTASGWLASHGRWNSLSGNRRFTTFQYTKPGRCLGMHRQRPDREAIAAPATGCPPQAFGADFRELQSFSAVVSEPLSMRFSCFPSTPIWMTTATCSPTFDWSIATGRVSWKCSSRSPRLKLMQRRVPELTLERAESRLRAI